MEDKLIEIYLLSNFDEKEVMNELLCGCDEKANFGRDLTQKYVVRARVRVDFQRFSLCNYGKA